MQYTIRLIFPYHPPARCVPQYERGNSLAREAYRSGHLQSAADQLQHLSDQPVRSNLVLELEFDAIPAYRLRTAGPSSYCVRDSPLIGRAILDPGAGA